MSDRDLPPKERAKALAKRVIQDELSLAGLYGGVHTEIQEPEGGWSFDDARVNSLVDAIMRGEETADVKGLMETLDIGRLRGVTPENQGSPPEKYLANPVAAQIWSNQREGWGGYGWTRKDINELGRNPYPRELTPGGRWARNRDANIEFLSGLLKAEDAVEAHRDQARHTQHGVGAMQDVAESNVYGGLADVHRNTVNSTLGTSGYAGAAMNPEYTFGKANVYGFIPYGEAAAIQHNKWLAEGKPIPHSGALGMGSIENLQWLLNAAGHYFSDSLPDAADLADARAAANKVEAVLPSTSSDGQARAAKGKAYALLRGLTEEGPTYDMAYRKRYGEWPSYLRSSLMTFGNNLLDPTIVAAPGAANLTRMIGKGLTMAGRAAIPTARTNLVAKLGSNFLRRWGSNLQRGSGWAKSMPYAAAALKEANDEIPFGIGLNGLFTFGPRGGEPTTFGYTSDPEQEAKRTVAPLPTDWLSGGHARTDLDIPDGKGGFRPMTTEEFEAEYKAASQGRDDAKRRTSGVLREVQQQLLPEPQRANPAPRATGGGRVVH